MIMRFIETLLAHRAWSPPPSSSFAEERTARPMSMARSARGGWRSAASLAPFGGARFPTLAA
jgi:hypothetical protein